MLCAFTRRLETVHRADFALLEGNGTIVGVKTGGHADGDVWGYWAVRFDDLCFVELDRRLRNQLPEEAQLVSQVTGQRVRSEVWSAWSGMEAMVAGDTVVREKMSAARPAEMLVKRIGVAECCVAAGLGA